MRRVVGVLVLAGAAGGVNSQAAGGWAAHQAPHWERDLLRATVLQVHGQRYYVRQQHSRLLLRDFQDEQAPDWVKRAHQLPLPTGLLLSGQTARLRWLLKVTAVPGGTQWNWAGQPLRDSVAGVGRPSWMPPDGQLMFSSEERDAGVSVIQQSYRFRQSWQALRQALRDRLHTAGWQGELTGPKHDRWVKERKELDLLYQRIAGDAGLYLILRETNAPLP